MPIDRLTLSRPRVLLEGLVQAQDGVAGVGLDVAEQAHVGLLGLDDARTLQAQGAGAARAFSMSWRSDSGVSLGA
jgi:hypothetical protein